MRDMFGKAAPSRRKTLNLPAPKKEDHVMEQSRSFTDAVLQAAANPDIDPVRFKQMVDMVAESLYHSALVEMDEEMPAIDKDGNIALKSGGKPIRFTSYEHLNRIIKPILRKYNFTLEHLQNVHPSGQGVVICSELTHGKPGDPVFTKRSICPIPTTAASPAMNAQQAYGSARSYAKRYNTIDLLNIQSEAMEDRDTNAVQVAPEKLVTQGQHAKMVKAIMDNKVPDELLVAHYVKPYCGGSEDVGALVALPAKYFNQFMNACKHYGEAHK